MPRKRKSSPKQPVQKAPAKQQKQDGQKAVSHDIVVPLDEGFHEGESSRGIEDLNHRPIVDSVRKPLTLNVCL